MKFLLFASIFSFAVAAAVGPEDNSDGKVGLINRDNNNIDRDPVPYRGVLKQKEAEDIANGYLSVLQNKDYNGQPPSKNWKKYVEKKYREIAGSINSLISKNNDVNAAVVTSGEAWYNDVKKFPVKSIKKVEILVAGRNNILIYAQFDKVGNARYNVGVFVLLRISEDKKVWEAVIEFNSIAWGFNTGQINQYCPKCPKVMF